MSDPLDILKIAGRDGDSPEGRYALSVGQLLGDYRILKPLGRGGMGEVYAAENTVSRKSFALKVLPPEATGSATFVERFRTEARVMMDLRHPNIVQVHHAGVQNVETPRGLVQLYYLTMDLVCVGGRGSYDLEALLSERAKLSEDESSAAAAQICAALAHAHGMGLVHRDLKPANVLVDADGILRVTDFGLAKVVGGEYLQMAMQRSVALSMGQRDTLGGAASSRSAFDVGSSTRSLMGTYAYMAPEQKTGQEATVQSDLYAFGLILYRMLTGDTAEGRFKLPSALGLDRAWDSIIEGCLEPKPVNRYASAAKLQTEISRVGRRAASATEDASPPVGPALRSGPSSAGGIVRSGKTPDTAVGHVPAPPAPKSRHIFHRVAAASGGHLPLRVVGLGAVAGTRRDTAGLRRVACCVECCVIRHQIAASRECAPGVGGRGWSAHVWRQCVGGGGARVETGCGGRT